MPFETPWYPDGYFDAVSPAIMVSVSSSDEAGVEVFSSYLTKSVQNTTWLEREPFARGADWSGVVINVLARDRFDDLAHARIVPAAAARFGGGRFVETVQGAATRYGLTEDETQDVMDRLLSVATFTRFSLANALSYMGRELRGHDLSRRERATELQQIAGKVVELPPDERPAT